MANNDIEPIRERIAAIREEMDSLPMAAELTSYEQCQGLRELMLEMKQLHRRIAEIVLGQVDD